MITFTANSTMLFEDLGAADGAHKRWDLLQSQRPHPGIISINTTRIHKYVSISTLTKVDLKS